jgi:peptidoglycan/xylan/chitin deacetylase (PgdA/CDA1 family)
MKPFDLLRRAPLRRIGIATLLSTAGVLLVALVQPPWLFAVLVRTCPNILWRVETSAPVVALTFDDGPAPDHTPQVLALLARHHARATFFLIGDRAAAHPEMVRTIRAAGHEIGNHYYTIRSTLRASDQEFLERLLRTETVLGLEGPIKLYRPPGGLVRRSQLTLARQHGYRCVLGSAYPFDPSHPPVAYIRWLVAKNLRPGTIVILHDGIADPSRTIDALDGILLAGERKGLRFVPVGELLASADVRPSAPGR